MGTQSQRPRRRLRVVTLVDRLLTSGGEIVATRVATGLDPARFESILCSSRPSDPADVARIEQSGVRVVCLDRGSRLDLLAWRTLVRLLRDEHVDVLHAHKFGSNVWGVALGRAARVPVVVAHEHTWSYVGQPLRRFLDRELIGRGADAFLSVSEEDRRRMVEIEGVDPGKARHVPNGIPSLPPGDGTAFRRGLGIADDAPLVGVVCALRPQKALDVLLRAAAVLASSLAEARVVVVGDGPERAALERLREELALEETVVLAGPRTHEELGDVLAALDVAVLSSSYEGTPLAVIEYMAAGKAIVATRVGGVPELIEDGIHGVLVEPGDPEALAEAVAALLRDPARRAELGGRARERQRREFGVEAMMHRLEELYETLYWSSERGRLEASAS